MLGRRSARSEMLLCTASNTRAEPPRGGGRRRGRTRRSSRRQGRCWTDRQIKTALHAWAKTPRAPKAGGRTRARRTHPCARRRRPTLRLLQDRRHRRRPHPHLTHGPAATSRPLRPPTPRPRLSDVVALPCFVCPSERTRAITPTACCSYGEGWSLFASFRMGCCRSMRPWPDPS